MSQVEVDYWENQRYRPLQGWSAPYQGGTPNYSDILGKDTITAEQVATDNFYLPQGWEWVEGQKWTVDLSGKHGHVDADGWSYGVSFESLIEQSKTRTLKSERSSAYLARRRRWIRPRICISSEINGVIALKLIWVNIVRERIVEVITNNEINYKKLSEYNARQKTIIESTLQHADSNLSEVSTNLELLNDKLQSMTAFLIERGNIENQYAKRLEALASKWINAGDPKRAAPTRRFSISFTDSSPAPASDASGGSGGGSGFFNVVSRANQSIAERLNEFSSLLCDGLPKDVNAINSEVVEALSECKKEGVEIRGTILSKSRQVDNSYESYRRCVEGSQLAMMAESEALYAAMYHSSATSTRGNKFSLSSSSGGGAGTGGGATAEGAAVVVAGGGGAAAASSSGSGGGVDVFSNLQQVDVWLAMQLYNADLIELDSLLLQYNAFVKQQQKKCDKVSASVGELLKSTVKAFAFEQFRVWQDSSSMLDSVSSHGSGGSVGNPMRDGSSGSSSSPLRDATTTTSSSSSGSPMAGLNPMRRSSFKMEGNTNYNTANSSSSSSTNNTAAATASSSSSSGVSSGLEEVREELVLDPDFDGNEDSGLVLPSHSHLRLSDSQLHYSRAEIVQYYFLRNGEGGPTVSSSSGGSGGGSVVDSINYGEFKQALAVLTYDRVLHLLHIDASVNNNSNSSSSSGSSSAAGASGASATAGGSSEVAALADSLSVSFDKSQLLLSLNVKPCAVSPIYLPRDGYREAFEIVIPKRGGGIITTSLTSLMTVGTQQQQQQQQQQQLRSISSVLIVFEDSLNVRNWMRCLSNPFVDPNIDSPSDYDCEENEYISMSSTYSNNKGDEVLG